MKAFRNSFIARLLSGLVLYVFVLQTANPATHGYAPNPSPEPSGPSLVQADDWRAERPFEQLAKQFPIVAPTRALNIGADVPGLSDQDIVAQAEGIAELLGGPSPAPLLAMADQDTSRAAAYDLPTAATGQPRAATAADAGQLISTPEADLQDPYLLAKASELGNDPQRIFEFVRDEIGYEVYTGSLRGARGTLWSKAGNALDQASLLIGLLRVAGISARYAQGILDQANARALVGSMFPPYLRVLGCPTDDTIIADPVHDPTLMAQASQHVWVEFESAGGFIAADPSFAQAQLGDAFAVAQTRFDEVPAALRHHIVIRVLAEYAGSSFGDAVNEQTVMEETLVTAAVAGKPLTIGHFINSESSGGLIGGSVTHTYSPYLLIGQNDAEISDDEILRGTDYQEFASSFFGGLATQALSGVFVEIEVASPTGSVETYRRPILDRAGYVIRHNGGSATLDVNIAEQPALSQFDLMTINALPGLLTTAALAHQQERLAAVQADLDALQPQIDALPDDYSNLDAEQQQLLNEVLTLNRNATIAGNETIGMTYAIAADTLLPQLQQGYLTKAYYASPRLLIAQTSQTDQQLSVAFDIRKNDMQVLPAAGQALNTRLVFEMTRGIVESQLEGEVLSQMLGTDASFAAIDIFEHLPEDDSVVYLETENRALLEQLDLSDEARLRIDAAIENNKVVIVPETMVTIEGQSRIAWLEIDRASGHTIAVGEDGRHSVLVQYYTQLASNFLNHVGGFFVGVVRAINVSIFTFVGQLFNGLNAGGQPFAAIVAQAKAKTLQYAIKRLITDFAWMNNKPAACMALMVESSNPLATGISCGLRYATGLLAKRAYGNWFMTFVSAGTWTGIFYVQAWMRRSLPYDPLVTSLLVNDLAPRPDPVAAGGVPDFAVSIVPDDYFVAAAGDAILPSVYIANIQNLGPQAEVFYLSFPAVPAGYTLKSSVSSLTIPAGETGQVGICLQPTADALDPSGTTVPVSVTVSTPSATPRITDTIFTVPDVPAVTLAIDPVQDATGVGTAVAASLTVTSTGNAAAGTVPLSLDTSDGLTVTGVPASVSLGLDESQTFPLTLTPAAGTENRTLTATVTASFGRDLDGNPYQTAAGTNLRVRSTTVLAIDDAANTAAAAGNDQLAQVLAELADATAALEQDPTDTRLCVRVTYLYDQLLQLAAVTPGLSGQQAAIQHLRDLAAGCNTPQLLIDGTQFFTGNLTIQAAATTPVVTLSPNNLLLEPSQSGQFTLRLENVGDTPLTLDLGVDPLPAGVTAALSQTRVTLAGGEVLDGTSPLPVLLTLDQTLDSNSTFAVRVTAADAANPTVSFSATALVSVHHALADVVRVTVDPSVIEPSQNSAQVSAEILNNANVERTVNARLEVLDQDDNLVQAPTEVAVDLVTGTETQVVDLGAIDVSTLADGTYRVRVTLYSTSGQRIPGRTGEALMFVGVPITASVRAEPTLVVPGSPVVETTIEVTNRLEAPSLCSGDAVQWLPGAGDSLTKIGPYVIEEYRDASTGGGDWTITGSGYHSGGGGQLWLRETPLTASVLFAQPSTSVAFMMGGDTNDGFATFLVDGEAVGTFDLYNLGNQTLVVSGLPYQAHEISVVQLGQKRPASSDDDIAIYGGAAVTCFPEPTLEWAWTSPTIQPAAVDVMMPPSVIDLDADGIPDIVFGSSSSTPEDWELGYLRAIRGADGSPLFTVNDPALRINTTSSVAVGDIDLDGAPEIIACDDTHRRLIAFENDGSFKWRSPYLEDIYWGAPAIADLDQDGVPEIIVNRQVLDNTGALLWTGTGGIGGQTTTKRRGLPLVSDVDLDGSPEVIAGNTAYSASGAIEWQVPFTDGFNAVANFDDDPEAEIVLVTEGQVYLLEHDGTLVWGPEPIPGGGHGGPPTIADYDNDGEPEIGVAGGSRYAVFETDGSLKWESPTQDQSSNVTGSSVFDFDGDGAAEVVYSDELTLRIYRGTDGTVLFERPLSSCTWFEYPLVADVDADGQAELVAVANSGCGLGSERGVFVYGSSADPWAATRSIWNQHSYHITNINQDGTIPQFEQPNWLATDLNNFRLNTFAPGDTGGGISLEVRHLLPDSGYTADPVSPTPPATLGSDQLLWTDSIPFGEQSRSYKHEGTATDLAPGESRAISEGTEITASLQIGDTPTSTFDFRNWSVIQYIDHSGSTAPSWQTTNEGRVAFQSRNADASIFLSDIESSNVRISGKLRVDTAGDDDAIGFVFGYQDDQHFYLFHWRNGTAGTAKRGMSLLKMHSDIPFDHHSVQNTDGIAGQSTNLFHADIPWEHFAAYDFDLEFKPGIIRIQIRQGSAVLASIDVSDDTYVDGRFGFFNASQEQSYYYGIAVTDLSNEITYTLELPPVAVAAAHIIDLTPVSLDADPGTTADYGVILANPTDTEQIYTLDVVGLEDLPTTLADSVTVPAGETLTVPLSVSVTPGTPSTTWAFAVTALTQSGGVDSVQGELVIGGVVIPTVTLGSQAVHIALIPNTAVAGQGTSARYTARVTNLGAQTETFDLSGAFPAGFGAIFGETRVTLLPGLSNYRDVALELTPPVGTTVDTYGFSVSATPASTPAVAATASATLQVVGLGVAVDLQPTGGGRPPTRFDLVVTNTGNLEETFDLALAGPVAAYAALEAAEVTLTPDESRTLAVDVAAIPDAVPGYLYLSAIATARSNTAVTDSDTEALSIFAIRGLSAQFDPDTQMLPEPGAARFPLFVRNTGNQEEAYRVLITAVDGPIGASLVGLDSQPTQVIEEVRLPAFTEGVIILDTQVQALDAAHVTVEVSTQDQALTADDTANVNAPGAGGVPGDERVVPTLNDWIRLLLVILILLVAMATLSGRRRS